MVWDKRCLEESEKLKAKENANEGEEQDVEERQEEIQAEVEPDQEIRELHLYAPFVAIPKKVKIK